jgi:HEAT repeat protein
MAAALAIATGPVLAEAAITLASAPPVVVKTEPVAGSIDVSSDLTEIRVTFSKAMQDGSWSWSTWGEENFPETTGGARYLADGRTCVLPVKLEPGRFYAIWLNSNNFRGFQDTGNRSAVPYLLTFVTAAGVAASAPAPNSPLTWLEEAGIDVNAVSFVEAPSIQAMIEEWEGDGRTRFRGVFISQLPADAAPLRQLQFVNSDHVNIERMVDAEGSRIPFNQVHRDRRYHYTAELPSPALPGSLFIYGNEGSMDSKVSRDASGVFTYRFTHTPGGSVPTRRVEVHRLPPGAELIERSSNTIRRERGGRIEVVLDEVIPVRGNSTVSYRYRLPEVGATGGQRPPEVSAAVSAAVDEAVAIISGCAEGDPRIEKALESLRPLDQAQVVSAIVPHLTAERDTLRRAAIYVLWKSDLSEIGPAVPPLLKLLGHEEDFTRGMASLALAERKVAESFASLTEMVQNDASAYARRCAAYALGRLGDRRAVPVLERALGDTDANVRANAQSALTMLNSHASNIAVEDLALRMLAAIRDKEDGVLKELAVDRVKGWRDGLPHFAFEIRERFQQMTGRPFTMRVEKSLVEGDLAAVKCLGPEELQGIYLVLFFVKSPDGWRNWSVRNSPPETPLSDHLRKMRPPASTDQAAAPPSENGEGEANNALTGSTPEASLPTPAGESSRLNPDQRLVLDWTERQFGSYFDAREFAGWTHEERQNLEIRCLDALKGAHTREYYQAINTLCSLRSPAALPALRELAFERRDKNNRDRWMAVRGLGQMEDRESIPELIHLVYHGNVNTRWWAQIALVELTGENFGADWEAWRKWWNDSGGQPPCSPGIVRWWEGQPDDESLSAWLAEADGKFLHSLGARTAM